MPAPKIITRTRKSAQIKRDRRPTTGGPETTTQGPWSLGAVLSPLHAPSTLLSPHKRAEPFVDQVSSPFDLREFPELVTQDQLLANTILDQMGMIKLQQEMTESLGQVMAKHMHLFDNSLMQGLMDRWGDHDYDVNKDPDPFMAALMREFFDLSHGGTREYNAWDNIYLFQRFALQKAWKPISSPFNESNAAKAFDEFWKQWQNKRKLKRSLDDSLASPVRSGSASFLLGRVKAEPRTPQFPFVTPPQSPTRTPDAAHPMTSTSTGNIFSDMTMGLGNFLGFSSPPVSPTKGSPVMSPKATTLATGTTLFGNLFGFASPPSSLTKGTVGSSSFPQPQPPQPDSTAFWPYATTPSSFHDDCDDRACYRRRRRRSTSKKRKHKLKRRASSKRKRTLGRKKKTKKKCTKI